MKAYIFSKRLFVEAMLKNGWKNDVPSDSAVVSILYPGEKHFFEQKDNIVNLDFYDVNGYEVENVIGMTDNQAAELFNFIEDNVGKHFFVHCNAGASRSQAVAEFLKMFYNYDIESFSVVGRYPNQHVLRLLKSQYYIKYPDRFCYI